MRYMLLVYTPQEMPAATDGTALQAMNSDYAAFGERVTRDGALVAGHALQSTASARTVRPVSGKPVVVDGPFAETKEQLAGFYILECADISKAAEYAALIPGAATGCVEVRQLFGHDPRVLDTGPGQRYVLLIYGEEAKFVPVDDPRFTDVIGRHQRFTEKMVACGRYAVGDALLPVATATTVRVRDGHVLRSDGPFAETKEQLGGFYELRCDSIDEAVAGAGEILGPTDDGCIEVRPVRQFA